MHARLRTSPLARESAREILRREAGLRFEPGLAPRLDDAIERASEAIGAGSTDELASRAQAGDRGAIDALVGRVLVGETWFFRDLPRLEVVRDRVIPQALAARGRARIWSCGCAGGEEPWSLAALALSVPGADAARIEILATDLDEGALARARRGEYRAWSLRHAPDDLIDSALVRGPDRARVRDELRGLVRFERVNLLDVAQGRREELFAAPWDAILCRNVLMYVEPDVATECIRRLAAGLAVGGALVLGAAEPPLPPELTAWAHNDLGGNVMVRPAVDPEEALDDAAGARAAMRQPVRRSTPATVIRRERVSVRPRSTSRPPAVASSPPGAPSDHTSADTVRAALDHADRGELDRALAMLDADPRTATDARALSARALLLEGSGRTAEAAASAERALILDGDRIDASIVAARARLSLGDRDAALRHVHRARRRTVTLAIDAEREGLLEASRATLLVLLDHLERRCAAPDRGRR
jgi:chemotaxis protein methyltransferase CheR